TESFIAKVGSSGRATESEAAGVPAAKVAAVMVADGHYPRSGSGSRRGSNHDRAVDPLFAAGCSRPNLGTRIGLTCRFPTGAATATGRCHRRSKMRIRTLIATVILSLLSSPAFSQSRRLLGGSAGGS